MHLLLLVPDHLHGLVSLPYDEAMTKVVAGFREITAKKTSVCWQQNLFIIA